MPSTSASLRFAIQRAALRSVIPAVLIFPASVTEAQPWMLNDKIHAVDPGAGNEFGGAVAIDHDTLAVGSYQADGAFSKTGAVYVFHHAADGNWVFDAKLFDDESNAFEWFGGSIDLDGDRMIIGAPFHDGVQSGSGGAFIFERDIGGNWSPVARIVAADGENDDYFGWSVAVSGDFAAIGCPQDSGNFFWSGSVYVYERDVVGNWNEVAHLFTNDEGDFEYFGTSVALEGGRLIAGAPQDTGVVYNSGAAYLFEHDGQGHWIEVEKLTPDPVSESSQFGGSVAISADRVVVGAVNDDTQATNAGAAYVFAQDLNGNWVQEAKLTADDGSFNDQLGISVSIDGDRIAAGAYWDGDLGSNSGSAYLFESDAPGSWAQVQKITAFDGDAGDWFGEALALDGQSLIIGSPNDDDHADRSGSAYIYESESDQPILNMQGDCPGPIQFELSGATSRGRIAFIYGFGEGSIQIPPRYPCAGTQLGLNASAKLAAIKRADANGNARIIANVPARLCSRIYLQALDLATCKNTNVLWID